jgi:protein-disulfide isomerase
MSKKQTRENSKRQILKEQRNKRQRQQRLILILGMVAVAFVIGGLLIYPTVQSANTPVGEIITITPVARPMANGTTMGDPNAPVKIDLFEDFQCPACRQYTESTESQVVNTFVKTGEVYYVFHQFPFIDNQSATKESHQAANASMCAAAQGRFWDYHDMLFANWQGENQGSFSDKRLVAFAQALGLDMNAFNACFKADTYQAKINEDLTLGQKMGVTGTPSVFVNGKQIAPGLIPTFDDIKTAVDAALAAKK